MSRKNEFFQACKPDNHYIFEHPESYYDWDDIVNAFIAGGLYADKNPEFKWLKLDDETLNNLLNYQRYLAYSDDNDEYSILDGMTIKMYYIELKISHVRVIDGPKIILNDY